MRLLLDTHALIWWLCKDPALSSEARRRIADPDAFVGVSPASAWEIAIKKTAGRLQAPDDLEDQVLAHQFVPMPITMRHALAAGTLQLHHKDPFDRMLVAQALVEGLTLVTHDRRLAAYGVPLLPT